MYYRQNNTSRELPTKGAKLKRERTKPKDRERKPTARVKQREHLFDINALAEKRRVVTSNRKKHK